MNRRLVIGLVAGGTLAMSGIYVFVYLYRWEWHRALVSGVIFLAAEIAIIGWALSSKISGLERKVDSARADRITEHLAAARDRPSAAFDWLSPRQSQTSVFLPILMGSGLVISAVAWLVERLARHTAGRVSDEHLAGRLSRLAPPPSGFLDDRVDPLRDLRGPIGGRR